MVVARPPATDYDLPPALVSRVWLDPHPDLCYRMRIVDFWNGHRRKASAVADWCSDLGFDVERTIETGCLRGAECGYIAAAACARLLHLEGLWCNGDVAAYCRSEDRIAEGNYVLGEAHNGTESRFLNGGEVRSIFYNYVGIRPSGALEPLQAAFDELITVISADVERSVSTGIGQAPRLIVSNYGASSGPGSHWFVVMYEITTKE